MVGDLYFCYILLRYYEIILHKTTMVRTFWIILYENIFVRKLQGQTQIPKILNQAQSGLLFRVSNFVGLKKFIFMCINDINLN